jgi:hypothetical protein
VVRHEADQITKARDTDELLRAHEQTHHRLTSFTGPDRTDIPTRKDVADAKKAMDKQSQKLAVRVEALGHLQALAKMKGEDTFLDWTLFESLRDDFRISDRAQERILAGEPDDSPFNARLARKMIAYVVSKKEDADGLLEALTVAWSKRLDQIREEADGLRAKYRSLSRRYKAALERRRRSHGLPGSKDLDKIQRYEAHLERGLHKALDRLRDLQEARGAAPPRSPSVAVAVVQAGPQNALGSQMAPFGSFALEAVGGVQENAGVDAAGGYK